MSGQEENQNKVKAENKKENDGKLSLSDVHSIRTKKTKTMKHCRNFYSVK